MPLFDVTKFKQKSTERLSSISGCGACGLSKRANYPKLSYKGKGKSGILIVGDAPTEQEDECGIAGASDHYLSFKRLLRDDFDFKIWEECWFVNAIGCRTSNPNGQHITYCRPRLFKIIEELKPKVIILLGQTALQAVIGNFWKHSMGSIQKWHGNCIPDRNVNAWLCPLLNADYLDNKNNKVFNVLFSKALKRILQKVDQPVKTFKEEASCVECITDENELNHQLSLLLEFPPKMLAMDYETTGLKPAADWHTITCCSFCCDQERVISFPIPKKGTYNRKLLKEILYTKRIPKSAHNMKFEHRWTKAIFNVEIQNWRWDTMIAAHILDNRPQTKSLKYQAYINFGTGSYDQFVSKYLKASTNDKKQYGDNAKNQIHKIPMNEQLIYCGIDSLVEYRLALKQMKELGTCL